MQVAVQMFARARDLAGCECVTVNVPANSTIGNLRQCLAEAYPALSGLLKHSALAVNGEYAAESAILTPDAEVALLPPVSGG